ncbi:hypothetical protein CVT24_008954 [Panaeolus cyanescens]|uniref:Proliferating cell nuclear antigen PCNA N-terminal domain-containing protein n=1 Tax=Panaeolus cyanescens TaxID=181874 RepID=A0A409YAW9_9AGAR|nr:hypothetical protein CVT24_008954 [Panaeolus cyanescens]
MFTVTLVEPTFLKVILRSISGVSNEASFYFDEKGLSIEPLLNKPTSTVVYAAHLSRSWFREFQCIERTLFGVNIEHLIDTLHFAKDGDECVLNRDCCNLTVAIRSKDSRALIDCVATYSLKVQPMASCPSSIPGRNVYTTHVTMPSSLFWRAIDSHSKSSAAIRIEITNKDVGFLNVNEKEIGGCVLFKANLYLERLGQPQRVRYNRLSLSPEEDLQLGDGIIIRQEPLGHSSHVLQLKQLQSIREIAPVDPKLHLMMENSKGNECHEQWLLMSYELGTSYVRFYIKQLPCAARKKAPTTYLTRFRPFTGTIVSIPATILITVLLGLLVIFYWLK